MKDRFLPYLRLQIARAWRHLPAVLGISLLLLAAVGLYAVNASRSYRDDEDKVRVKIGVVGDVEDPYIQMVLFAMNNMDSMGFSVRLEQLEEEAAHESLMAGELHSYVIFPEGFEEKYYAREPVTLTYVTSPTSSGLGNALSDEIAHAMARLFGDGQDAINGLQRYVQTVRTKGGYARYPEEVTTGFTGVILSREKLFDVDEYGVMAGQGFAGYLGISLVTFFVLVWGVCCAPLFSRKNGENKRLLRAAGLGAVRQILAEYVPFALLSLIGILSTALLAGTVVRFAAPGVLETVFFEAGSEGRFLLRLAAVTLCFSALHFLLYQAAKGTVAAVLIQTLTALAVGYVSGCFYTKDFFPPLLRAVGKAMPASFAIRFLSGYHFRDGLPLLGFFLLFLALSCLTRRVEMAGDGV